MMRSFLDPSSSLAVNERIYPSRRVNLMRPKSLDHDARDPVTVLNPLPPPILPELLWPHISVLHIRLPVRWWIPSRIFDLEEDVSSNLDNFIISLSVHLLFPVLRSAGRDILRNDCSPRLLVTVRLLRFFEVEIGLDPITIAVARVGRISAVFLDGAWVVVCRM